MTDDIPFERPHSDVLPLLREIFKKDGLFPFVNEIFQFRLIIDANVVIRSILWNVKHRKNPEARTDLIELLDCETIKGFAPTYLQEEIHKKLPELAYQKKLPLDALRENWSEIEGKIRFVDVGGVDESSDERDPKDVPYLRLQEELGYTILTDDKDIEGMGGSVMPVNLLLKMREYSRESAVEYSIKAAGAATYVFSSVAVEATTKDVLPLLRRAVPGSGRAWMIGAGAFLVLLLLYPPTRRRIFDSSKRILNTLSPIVGGLIDLYAELAKIHYESKEQAREAADDFRDRVDDEQD